MDIVTNSPLAFNGTRASFVSDRVVFSIDLNGSLKIKDYNAFFKTVVEQGPFIKNKQDFIDAYREYHSHRGELMLVLGLKQNASDQQIINALREKFIFISDSTPDTGQDIIDKKTYADSELKQLTYNRLRLYRAGLMQGYLYVLAEELLVKKDFKNAKIALAISYVFTLFNPGTNINEYVLPVEYRKQVELLPIFIKNYYLKKDDANSLSEAEYKIIKEKLLNFIDQK